MIDILINWFLIKFLMIRVKKFFSFGSHFPTKMSLKYLPSLLPQSLNKKLYLLFRSHKCFQFVLKLLISMNIKS